MTSLALFCFKENPNKANINANTSNGCKTSHLIITTVVTDLYSMMKILKQKILKNYAINLFLRLRTNEITKYWNNDKCRPNSKESIKNA